MKPIPKSLLIHKAVLKRPKAKDRWGSTEYENDVTLQRVRMEPLSKIIRDKNNQEIQLAALLFFDCRNSRPTGQAFQLDDIVVFNGQQHRIQVIDPLYDGRGLHHYEIGLIRHA